MSIYVLYHKNCMDGLGAKYAAYKQFEDSAHYIAVDYKDPLPEIPAGSIVFILDFSYSREILEELNTRCQVIVLDHHKTAKENLEGLPYAIFDMNKSGAVLAWEYFHPMVPVPGILEFIQDRDLWTWKLQGTAEIGTMLGLTEGDFQQWDDIEANLDLSIRAGKSICEYKDFYVKNYVNDSTLKIVSNIFNGYTAGVINSTHLSSEIGSYVCENYPVDMCVIYTISSNGLLNLSFRSKKDSDVDVSEFAKKFGGGGHKSAAGAYGVDLSVLTEWMFSN